MAPVVSNSHLSQVVISPLLWGGFMWAEEKTKHPSLYLPTSTCHQKMEAIVFNSSENDLRWGGHGPPSTGGTTGAVLEVPRDPVLVVCHPQVSLVTLSCHRHTALEWEQESLQTLKVVFVWRNEYCLPLGCGNFPASLSKGPMRLILNLCSIFPPNSFINF